MGYTFPGQRVDLGGGRGWLDRPHAESIFRIDREIGHRLQITEAGRTWDEQNAHFQTYLRVGYPIALSPDTPSVHQQGGAIDSNEAQQMQARMEDHGWRRTVYRWVNGVWTLVERWHYERFAHLDYHRNDPAPAGGDATPLPKPPTEEEQIMGVKDDIVKELNKSVREIVQEEIAAAFSTRGGYDKYSIINLADDGGSIWLVNTETDKRVHIRTIEDVERIRRFFDNTGGDPMLTVEYDIVRGYMAQVA